MQDTEALKAKSRRSWIVTSPLLVFAVAQTAVFALRLKDTGQPVVVTLQVVAVTALAVAVGLGLVGLAMRRFLQFRDRLRASNPASHVWMVRRELDTELAIGRIRTGFGINGTISVRSFIFVVLERESLALYDIADSEPFLRIPKNSISSFGLATVDSLGKEVNSISVSLSAASKGIALRLVVCGDRFGGAFPQSKHELQPRLATANRWLTLVDDQG